MVRLLLAMCVLCSLGCGGDERAVAAVPDDDGGAAGNGGRYTGGLPGSPGTGKGTDEEPKVSTDIEADILLSDLDETEAVDLCEAVVKASEQGFNEERYVRLTCYVFALSYATLEDGSLDDSWCEVELERCLSEIKTVKSQTCEKASIVEQFGACNAKVGDLEACIEESAAELRRLLDGLTCNEVSYEKVDTYFNTARPASCRSLILQCPDLDLSRSSEMGLAPSPSGCDNNCPYARNGLCDDGGSGSTLAACGLGTDCADCGPRD